jgi:hypothetical protein
MKRVLREIWGLVKLFPFGSYGIFVLFLLVLLLLLQPIYDTAQALPGLVFLIFLLDLPLQLVGNVIKFLGMGWLLNLFNAPLVVICFFLILLDLLLLYLRKHLIPIIRSKFKPKPNPKND